MESLVAFELKRSPRAWSTKRLLDSIDGIQLKLCEGQISATQVGGTMVMCEGKIVGVWQGLGVA